MDVRTVTASDDHHALDPAEVPEAASRPRADREPIDVGIGGRVGQHVGTEFRREVGHCDPSQFPHARENAEDRNATPFEERHRLTFQSVALMTATREGTNSAERSAIGHWFGGRHHNSYCSHTTQSRSRVAGRCAGLRVNCHHASTATANSMGFETARLEQLSHREDRNIARSDGARDHTADEGAYEFPVRPCIPSGRDPEVVHKPTLKTGSGFFDTSKRSRNEPTIRVLTGCLTDISYRCTID